MGSWDLKRKKFEELDVYLPFAKNEDRHPLGLLVIGISEL